MNLTHILALFMVTTMIVPVATINLQQASAFGFVERQQITENFQKLTAQFEKAVIGATQPPEPEKIGQFRQKPQKAITTKSVLKN